MKKFNVWKNLEPLLETHRDDRGIIADIFYNANINHVAIINSMPGSIRGDHYHKHTTQHVLVIKGKLEYWHKPVEFDGPAEVEIMKEGDFVITPPFEIHTFRILTDNQFLAFSEGQRGGKDYEKDTYRYSPSLIIDN